MLFHVLSQHSWETCEGTRQARGEDVTPLVERQRWVEGNGKVKVIGAWGYQTEHRNYAIVEADDYLDVRDLFRDAGHMHRGHIEVLPLTDMIALRKKAGDWGK